MPRWPQRSRGKPEQPLLGRPKPPWAGQLRCHKWPCPDGWANYGLLALHALALPVSVYLGAIGPQTPLPLSQIVTLTRREGTFHVRKVASSDPRVEARAEMEQEGTQYRLTLTCRGGGAPGVLSAKIYVDTDDPHQPRLEIPVFASVIGDAGAER